MAQSMQGQRQRKMKNIRPISTHKRVLVEPNVDCGSHVVVVPNLPLDSLVINVTSSSKSPVTTSSSPKLSPSIKKTINKVETGEEHDVKRVQWAPKVTNRKLKPSKKMDLLVESLSELALKDLKHRNLTIEDSSTKLNINSNNQKVAQQQRTFLTAGAGKSLRLPKECKCKSCTLKRQTTSLSIELNKSTTSHLGVKTNHKLQAAPNLTTTNKSNKNNNKSKTKIGISTRKQQPQRTNSTHLKLNAKRLTENDDIVLSDDNEKDPAEDYNFNIDKFNLDVDESEIEEIKLIDCISDNDEDDEFKTCFQSFLFEEMLTTPRIANQLFDNDEIKTDREQIIESRLSRPISRAAVVEDEQPNDEIIQWKKGHMLGRGAFGKVWCGLTITGELIAVKQAEINWIDMQKARVEYEKIQEEVELLKYLCHQNIVGYLGTTLVDNVVSIFMQFVPGGSLASLLGKFGALAEPVVVTYTRQILQGLVYLHAKQVIHRDIKGSNILLMPTGVIKLIDFGCAKRLMNMNRNNEEILKSMKGTPYWMAPEVINGTGHGTKSDIWSVGCTIYEMFTSRPPFSDLPRYSAIYAIGSGEQPPPSLPSRSTDAAKCLFSDCLIRNTKQRPSAETLLNHEFLHGSDLVKSRVLDSRGYPRSSNDR